MGRQVGWAKRRSCAVAHHLHTFEHFGGHSGALSIGARVSRDPVAFAPPYGLRTALAAFSFTISSSTGLAGIDQFFQGVMRGIAFCAGDVAAARKHGNVDDERRRGRGAVVGSPRGLDRAPTQIIAEIAAGRRGRGAGVYSAADRRRASKFGGMPGRNILASASTEDRIPCGARVSIGVRPIAWVTGHCGAAGPRPA